MDASRDAGPTARARPETAARLVAIVYNTAPGTALSISKVMPYIWVGIFMAWTFAYGRHQGKKGQRAMAAATAEEPGTARADSAGPAPGRPRA